jgi:hypothetical protein
MARPKEAAVLGLEHFSSSEADENKGGTARMDTSINFTGPASLGQLNKLLIE